MTRDHRPSVVVCARCDRQLAAYEVRDARELVLSWSKTNRGEGTMTNAGAPMKTGVYVCKPCWTQRLERTYDKLPPEIHVIVGRVATFGRQILHFLIPKPTELFPDERSSTA